MTEIGVYNSLAVSVSAVTTRRACAGREDELAGGRMAGGGARGCGSVPKDAGGLAPAAGTGQGDATGTCESL